MDEAKLAKIVESVFDEPEEACLLYQILDRLNQMGLDLELVEMVTIKTQKESDHGN